MLQFDCFSRARDIWPADSSDVTILDQDLGSPLGLNAGTDRKRP